MKPHPPVLHNSIERDNKLKWHPVIELRHKGVLIYAIASVKGYIQPGIAAQHGLQDVKALLEENR